MLNIKSACNAINATAYKRNWRGLSTSELTRAERAMLFIEKYVGHAIKPAEEALFYADYDSDNPLAVRSVHVLGDIELRAADLIVHLAGTESKANHEIRYPYAGGKALFKAARKLVEDNVVLDDLIEYATPNPGEHILVSSNTGASFTVYK